MKKINVKKLAQSLQAGMESIVVFANLMNNDSGFFDNMEMYLGRTVSLRTTKEIITGKIINMKPKFIEIQTKDGDIGRFRKKFITGIMQTQN